MLSFCRWLHDALWRALLFLRQAEREGRDLTLYQPPEVRGAESTPTLWLGKRLPPVIDLRERRPEWHAEARCRLGMG